MSFSYSAGTSTPNLAGLVEVGSIRLNDGTFYLTGAPGLLLGSPAMRPAIGALASDHGGYMGTPFYSPREFVLEGYLRTPLVDDIWGAIDLLMSTFNLASTALKTLTLNTKGWATTRQISARLNGEIQILPPSSFDEHMIGRRSFSIPMVAPDPRIYSTTLQSVTVATGGTALTNNGTVPTPFTVRFNGAQTTPMRLLDPSSKKIEVLSSPTSGHYVDVNTRDATNGTLTAVTDTGASAYANVNDSDAVTIAPGTTTWTRTNGAGAGTTVVSFRDAWV